MPATPFPPGREGEGANRKGGECMPKKRPSVKNEKQYEGLKKKGMSKERAARIANSPGASKRGGKKAAAKRKKKSS
jgi:hypothetical protein